jgi:hypothetical protein
MKLWWILVAVVITPWPGRAAEVEVAEPNAPTASPAPETAPPEPNAATPAQAPEPNAATPAPSADAIQVEPSFAGKTVLFPTDPIELHLSRPLRAPDEVRAAVLLGTTDISGLFEVHETSLKYTPGVTPLPTGQQDLQVYLCTSDKRWIEIARFPIRVLGRLGFEKADVKPKLDLALNGQAAEDHFPEDPPPPRATFQDLTVTGRIESEHQRREFDLKSQFNGVGFTNQNQALRFGFEGDAAPQIDLADYLISVQQGPFNLSLGNVSVAGTNRHLVSTFLSRQSLSTNLGNFETRGLALSMKLGQRADVAVSAVNATNIVGFDDFTGFAHEDQRIVSGTIGLELLPRAGGLRLETTLLDGRASAQTGFSQGAVTDPQRDRALALRLLGSIPSQRVRVDAGFTRSEFNNPPDPLLSQGVELVPVQEETKNAYYVDLSLDLLQGVKLTEKKTASASVVLKHERVDPLFRTITGSALADRLTDQIDVQGSLAEVTIQATHQRVEDNLGDIASILKTLTRRNFLSIGVPVAPLLGLTSAFLPTLSYSFDRTHQFGDSVPVNGEFDDPSKIPDQVSTSQQATAEWRAGRVGLRYSLSHSFQDNRQPQRENADLVNLTNGLTLDLSPLDTLSLTLEGSLERAENQELSQVNRTRRLAFNGSWRPLTDVSLALQTSQTHAEDDAGTSQSDSFTLNATGSWSVAIFKSVRGQVSLAVNRTTGEDFNRVFGTQSRTRNTTVQTGLSLSLF